MEGRLYTSQPLESCQFLPSFLLFSSLLFSSFFLLFFLSFFSFFSSSFFFLSSSVRLRCWSRLAQPSGDQTSPWDVLHTLVENLWRRSRLVQAGGAGSVSKRDKNLLQGLAWSLQRCMQSRDEGQSLQKFVAQCCANAVRPGSSPVPFLAYDLCDAFVAAMLLACDRSDMAAADLDRIIELFTAAAATQALAALARAELERHTELLREEEQGDEPRQLVWQFPAPGPGPQAVVDAHARTWLLERDAATAAYQLRPADAQDAGIYTVLFAKYEGNMAVAGRCSHIHMSPEHPLALFCEPSPRLTQIACSITFLEPAATAPIMYLVLSQKGR